jgi:hypothetical protein
MNNSVESTMTNKTITIAPLSGVSGGVVCRCRRISFSCRFSFFLRRTSEAAKAKNQARIAGRIGTDCSLQKLSNKLPGCPAYNSQPA